MTKHFIVVTFHVDADGEQFEQFALVANTTEGEIVKAFGGAVGTTHVVNGREITLDHVEEVETIAKGVNLLALRPTWLFVDMSDGTVSHRTDDHMDGVVVDQHHFMFGYMK